jgi:zinc protease
VLLPLLLLASAPGLADSTAAPPSAPTIPFEKYELGNGLDVILSPDHSVPFVQVNLWYDVGSKDEEAGRTGFAHLFEHLMFQGSQNMDDDYFVPLHRIGAQVNGTTNLDRTNYFEGVPSEQLALALWLESDRMGFLLPALTEEKLQNQKEVVRNERRQRYEITPYGEVWVWLYENLFPPTHPYHVPTIGRHEDIDAATLDDVKAFFRKWYVPNNASLSICGDFDAAEAKELVARYFAGIPRGAEVQSVRSASASLDREVVVRKTDDVPHQKVWVAWHSPALFQPGDAELDVVSNVLADGKDSRLYTALVREKQVATEVNATQVSARLGSIYLVSATAATGRTSDEVVREIDAVIAKLRAEGPTPDEVAVAKTNWEANFYGGLGTIAAKANQLNSYNVLVGDPGFLAQDLQRYLDTTQAGIHEAVRTWLPADKRVVLHVSPEAPAQKGGK